MTKDTCLKNTKISLLMKTGKDIISNGISVQTFVRNQSKITLGTDVSVGPKTVTSGKPSNHLLPTRGQNLRPTL